MRLRCQEEAFFREKYFPVQPCMNSRISYNRLHSLFSHFSAKNLPFYLHKKYRGNIQNIFNWNKQNCTTCKLNQCISICSFGHSCNQFDSDWINLRSILFLLVLSGVLVLWDVLVLSHILVLSDILFLRIFQYYLNIQTRNTSGNLYTWTTD